MRKSAGVYGVIAHIIKYALTLLHIHGELSVIFQGSVGAVQSALTAVEILVEASGIPEHSVLIVLGSAAFIHVLGKVALKYYHSLGVHKRTVAVAGTVLYISFIGQIS